MGFRKSGSRVWGSVLGGTEWKATHSGFVCWYQCLLTWWILGKGTCLMSSGWDQTQVIWGPCWSSACLAAPCSGLVLSRVCWLGYPFLMVFAHAHQQTQSRKGINGQRVQEICSQSSDFLGVKLACSLLDIPVLLLCNAVFSSPSPSSGCEEELVGGHSGGGGQGHESCGSAAHAQELLHPPLSHLGRIMVIMIYAWGLQLNKQAAGLQLETRKGLIFEVERKCFWDLNLVLEHKAVWKPGGAVAG